MQHALGMPPAVANRPRGAGRRAALAIVVLAGLTAPSAHAAPLVYHGTVVPRREVETLFAAARSPADSAALQRALEALQRRLQDGGWLNARVHAAWDTLRGGGLEVAVEEGIRHRWAAPRIVAPSPAESARIATALAVRTGGWASPPMLAGAMDRSVHALAEHGYPYTRLALTRWSADSGSVALWLDGATGPLVTVTRARVEGLHVTQPRLAGRAVARLAGRPWDRAEAEAGRERLEQMGLFRTVTLQGLAGGADAARGEVVYRVEEPRYNRFEGVVGVQGAAGVVGLAHLELGNLLGTGRVAALHWDARGQGVSQFEARYVEPLLFGSPLRLEGAVSQQVQDTIWTRSVLRGTARWSLPGHETLEGSLQQERVVQPHGALERAELQTTSFAYERSTLDRSDAPARGTRVRLLGAQTFERQVLRPADHHRVRTGTAELLAQWVVPVRGAFASLLLRGASRFTTERLLPPYERFVVGGATTLRGFDEEAFHVDRFALSRLEWGWSLGGAQRAFLFWDHGWMSTRLPLAAPATGDRLELRHADGVGAGLRLDSGAGLIGLDYGLQPGRPPLEGKLHLQLVSTF
jgi:outer membrane protein assembly factor BamA